MLELVHTFLCKLPGASERIIKYNKERMWLKGSANSEDIRYVYALQMNFILIGMPGVGKSYWGNILSQTFNLDFIDGDELLENKYGKDLLNRIGNKRFCHYEAETLCDLHCTNTVIAPGGSAIYSQKTMKHLKGINSYIIFLQNDIHTIQSRVGNLIDRGVVMKKGQTFQDLFDERTPLYDYFSDVTINCSHKTNQIILTELSQTITGKYQATRRKSAR